LGGVEFSNFAVGGWGCVLLLFTGQKMTSKTMPVSKKSITNLKEGFWEDFKFRDFPYKGLDLGIWA